MSLSDIKRSAAFNITIGSDLVGRCTSFGTSTTVSEEMVSGTEQTTTGDNAILEEYVAVSVGKTANFGGVALKDNDGQIALEEAADDGEEGVTIEVRFEDGSGYDYIGFLTNFEKSFEMPNVARFTAQMRVNSKIKVPAPS